jgi:hypothetical protein
MSKAKREKSVEELSPEACESELMKVGRKNQFFEFIPRL